MISATENAEKNASLSYDTNDNLASFKDERNAQYTYTYATSGNKHRLLTATNNASGVKYAYSYYGSGTGKNLKAQEISNSSGSILIRNGINYTAASGDIKGGAYILRENDQHGYSTTYDYNLQSGLLNSVTDAKGNQTAYTYDSNNGNLSKVESGGKSVTYAYDSSKTRLTGITHNGFNYNFTYDAFGNVLTTTAAGTTLMTNTYGSGNGLLNKSTYGNGNYVNYVYDELGRTTRINKNGSNAYYWRYNANGMPAIHTDYLSNRVYYYTYDSLGRLVRCNTSTKGTTVDRFISQYRYDSSNNVTKIINISDGTRSAVNYNYDDANRPSSVDFGSVDIAYVYDSLGRLYTNTLNTTTPVTVTYTYNLSKRNEDSASTYRTTQIGWETIGNRTYEYTYDKVGNITQIREKVNGGSYKVRAGYTYDSLGQLIRENNLDLNKTIEYTYDNGGNLKSKTEYAYTTATKPSSPTKTINYTYDSTWKDKLISYDGDSITYDAIGNPLTYRDSMSFTWNGRQMKTANLNGTSVSYKYNADGLRTYKKVGSTVYEYEYLGDKLIYENRGGNQFHYRYDAYGNLASITRVTAEGITFTVYVICNSRGDVEELRMADGSLYARYIYDTWGNTVKILDANGNTVTDPDYISVQNPIRYRGYYFDAESGLYYVNCRYYDAQTGRFINADSTDIVTISKTSLADKNLFAYCDNNPITRTDSNGECWHVVAGAVVGGVTSAVSTAMTLDSEGDIWDVFISGAIGSVAGGLTAALPQFSVAINAGSAALESSIYGARKGHDLKTTLTNAAVSAGFGALTGSQGSDFSGKSGSMINKAIKSISKSTKGNHPIVKGNAKKTIKTAVKYVSKKYSTGQVFDTAVSFIKTGVQKVANWFVDTLFGG